MDWMNELWHNPKKMPFHVPWNSCCQPGCCRMVVIDDIYQPHLQLSHCSFHLWLVFFSQTHHPPRLIDQYLTLFLPTKTCFLNSLRNYPLVNYLSWLVVEPYPSEKYEIQLGWWHSQYDGKVKKNPWFQSPPSSFMFNLCFHGEFTNSSKHNRFFRQGATVPGNWISSMMSRSLGHRKRHATRFATGVGSWGLRRIGTAIGYCCKGS